MKFTFVSLFPHLLKFYFEDSILKHALDKKLFELDFINPRDFSANKHKKVDDYKISGGAGLLISAQPLFDALDFIKQKDKNTHFVFAIPAAKPFRQNDAKRLAKHTHICFVCGRYEGIDERVIEEYANELFSLGDFILTGGELASLAFCDAIARNIKGVLNNEKSLYEESFENNLLEAPSFTKPFEFCKNSKKFLATSVFLKGNHNKIASLKYKFSICKTKFFRPDLLLKDK